MKSWAKLNLALKIGSPLESGYHPIQSVFQTINLCDIIKISVEKAPQLTFDIQVQGASIENNLLRTLFDSLVWKKPVKLSVGLQKRIPIGAGLGGGSSNVATVLKFLKEKALIEITEKTLFETALKCGADVPFFLEGGAAFVQGIGEVISTLPPLYKEQAFLLIQPGFSLSTQEMYHLLDDRKQFSDQQSYSQIVAAKENDFKPIAWEKFSFYPDLEKFLSASFAKKLYLSGSGSVCFVHFEDDSQEDIDFIMSQIQQKWPACKLYKTKAIYPKQDLVTKQ